jgi:hypothetical protein
MTVRRQYQGAAAKLAGDRFAALVPQIERARELCYGNKDRVLYDLDLGLLHHFAGAYERSNLHLERAERAIEENFTRSVSRAAASLLLNDNVLEYTGDPYEDVSINVFKAANYLHQAQFDEAFVEIRRLHEKLNLLEDKYARLARGYGQGQREVADRFKAEKVRFHNSALGRYLSVLMYRAEGRADDAAIDAAKLSEAFSAQPLCYPFPRPSLPATSHAAGRPRLTVLAFSGACPEKRANTYLLHTTRNAITVAFQAGAEARPRAGLLTIPWPGIEEGMHLKLEVPVLVRRPSAVRAVEARIDGKPVALERIESLEAVAEETFRVQESMVLMRAVARTVLKGMAQARARREMAKRIQDQDTNRLLGDLLAVAVDLTENADLRGTPFLPGAAFVADVPVEAGTHRVEVRFLGADGRLIHTDRKSDVAVAESGVCLVEAHCLDGEQRDETVGVSARSVRPGNARRVHDAPRPTRRVVR